MESLVWSEEYSVGVHSLDEQHKRLIGFINTLNKSDGVSSEELHGILNDMATYAREHLDYEEKLLNENGYPEKEKHSKLHNEFMDALSEYSLEVIEDNAAVMSELRLFLEDWWQHHILEEDMKYKAFFEEIGIK